MGGFVSFGGKAISSAAGLLSEHSQDSAYYKQMAQAADRQAKLTQENAQRQAGYLFKSAALENKRLSADYAQLAGEQKTALAASGLGATSATTQAILRNSRLNAIMDEEAQRDNLSATLYENNTAAAQEARVLQEQASQYRRMRKNRVSFWGKLNRFSGLIQDK